MEITRELRQISIHVCDLCVYVIIT